MIAHLTISLRVARGVSSGACLCVALARGVVAALAQTNGARRSVSEQ